jgi:hypothetical protein
LEEAIMKRTVLTVILIICAFMGVYGQNTPMDVVLLLDTSSGMSSSYENVNNYITGSFLSEFLRVGDTFHLIAFSASPRLDAARRVTSIGDVETIIGRMLLQYPVESGNNIGSAISFAEQYIASLPARPKKIVMVSSGSDTNNLVGAARQRLSSSNTSFDFVQVTSGQPLANLPSSGRPAASRTASPAPAAAPAAAIATPAPAAQTTPAAQQQRPAATPPEQQRPVTPPPAAQTQTTPATSAQTGTSTQTPPAAVTPPPAVKTDSPETAAAVKPAESASSAISETAKPGVSAAGSEDSQPAAETKARESARETSTPSSLPRQERKSSGTSWASSIPFIIGIIILALFILGVIVFFATRRLGSSPDRVMAEAASSKPEHIEEQARFADHSKDLAKYASRQNRRTTPYDNKHAKQEAKTAVINPSGPLILNLFVEDQNTAIGKRNIHSLKSGYSLSVGGGQSDFLIFLVPMPSRIGEIRRNGSQCTFIPLKPKYFPDLGSNELKDCINKTIRVISDKDYELRFRFEMYEDPLIALNRILMSVKVPGL